MKLEHPQVQLCKKKTQVLEWHQKQGSFPTLLGATVTWGQEATECKTSGLHFTHHRNSTAAHRWQASILCP